MTVAVPASRPSRAGVSSAPLRIQILHVPDCPLVGQLRALVRHALVRCDLRAEIEEAEGAYPSPTLLVDGSDGAGRCIEGGLACRLDLPTEDQIVAALVARAK